VALLVATLAFLVVFRVPIKVFFSIAIVFLLLAKFLYCAGTEFWSTNHATLKGCPQRTTVIENKMVSTTSYLPISSVGG
jgi:hypothetical protein